MSKFARFVNCLDQVTQKVIQNYQMRREFLNAYMKLKWNLDHN